MGFEPCQSQRPSVARGIVWLRFESHRVREPPSASEACERHRWDSKETSRSPERREAPHARNVSAWFESLASVNHSSRQICKATPGSVELVTGIWRTVLELTVELCELGAIRDITATDPPKPRISVNRRIIVSIHILLDE